MEFNVIHETSSTVDEPTQASLPHTRVSVNKGDNAVLACCRYYAITVMYVLQW